MFITVPPLLAVAKLLPRAGRWFADLAWVRLLTFRPQRSSSDESPPAKGMMAEPVEPPSVPGPSSDPEKGHANV